MARYLLKRSAGIQFSFSLVSDQNETILTGEAYATKAGAEHGIRSVRLHSPFETNYIRKTASRSQFTFLLIAMDGETLGTGELHTTAAGRDASIKAVKATGRGAVVEDQLSVRGAR